MSDQFRREYLLRLPLPLAQLYSRAHNAKDTRTRHDNCYYIFESLIKLTACPLIGAYIDDLKAGKPHVQAVDRALAHLALPSLGQWVAMLRELSRHYGNDDSHKGHPLRLIWRQLNRKHAKAQSPAILGLYRRIKHGPDGKLSGESTCTLLDLFDKVVRYRNDVVGHGGPRFDHFFEKEMGPLMFPAVNEVLEEGTLDPLGPAGTRLVYLTEMRMIEEGKYEVAMRELIGLQGERSAPMTFDADLAETLAPRHGSFPGLALIWPGHAAPLRLGPMMRFRESEVADEVLLLNRDRGGRQVEYLSYTTGRTERDAEMAGAMAMILSRVTSRDISEDQVKEFEASSRSEGDSIEALVGDSRLSDGRAPRLGDYELLAELGRGGMGVVYLARQSSLGRVVALKTLPGDLSSNERALARFRREMRVLGSCEHPNIVKLLDSGTLADGQIYYTMEYVPGADLEQVWKELSKSAGNSDVTSTPGTAFASALDAASHSKRSEVKTRYQRTVNPLGRQFDDDGEKMDLPDLPLPDLPQVLRDEGGDYRQDLRHILGLMSDACRALHTVHQQGVIHRDVSPGNLMVTPDGQRIVLMDFGLAKGGGASQTVSVGAGFMGKLRYAAPEQLASAVLDIGPAADVRGLGATLWEMITHKRLFEDAQDERSLATMIHQRDVPRLREVDPGFDRDLEAIVARACERESPKRIQSAEDLADYLDMYLMGEPLPIRPPTTSEIMLRWVRRKKALVGSLVFGISVIALILVLSFRAINEKAEEAFAAQRSAEAARAESEASAEQLKQSLGNIFETITTSDVFRGTGLEGPQREVLLKIVQEYQDTLDQVGDDPELQFALARTLRNLAQTSLQLEQSSDAEDQALMTDRLFQRLPATPDVQVERAILGATLARIYLKQGRVEDGVVTAEQAVNDAIPLLDQYPDRSEVNQTMAQACQVLGDLKIEQGELTQARSWYEQAVALRFYLYQLAIDADPDQLPSRLRADELADVQLQVARSLEADDKLAEAQIVYANIIDILSDFDISAGEARNRLTQPMRLKLAIARRNRAFYLPPDRRLIEFEASVQLLEALAIENPDRLSYHLELARSLLALATHDPFLLTDKPDRDPEEVYRIRNDRKQAFDHLLLDVLARMDEMAPPDDPVIHKLRQEAYEAYHRFETEELRE
ncbi:MAG: protein kinase [Planctomycetota bacterium]